MECGGVDLIRSYFTYETGELHRGIHRALGFSPREIFQTNNRQPPPAPTKQGKNLREDPIEERKKKGRRAWQWGKGVSGIKKTLKIVEKESEYGFWTRKSNGENTRE